MTGGTFWKGAERLRADGKAAGVLQRSRRTLRPFVDFVQIECGKQPFFGKVAARRKVPHRASEKAKKHPCQGAFFALAEAAKIRTRGRLPVTAFRVRLVMTTSIRFQSASYFTITRAVLQVFERCSAFKAGSLR